MYGAFFAIESATRHVQAIHVVNPIPFAVWAMASESEGGLGFPLLCTFMAGSGPGPSFPWRDTVGSCRGFHFGGQAVGATLANGSGDIIRRAAEGVVRNPYLTKHCHPMNGYQRWRTPIREAFRAHPHSDARGSLVPTGPFLIPFWPPFSSKFAK